MASYKDTFEANTYEARTFASGHWRGTGVAVLVIPGVEYHLQDTRPHYNLDDARPHYNLKDTRPHYRSRGTDV